MNVDAVAVYQQRMCMNVNNPGPKRFQGR